MATTLSESGPMFNRVLERGKTSSWRSAAPAVAMLVLAVVVFAYLASRLTSYSQQAATAQQEAQAAQKQLEATQKRSAVLERDLNAARSAGRTTLILESSGKAAKGAAKAWGAATWGELPDGKSWVRVVAYGLQAPPEGKEYRVWFEPASGAAVPAGKLERGADGNAFGTAQDLPAVDQGKRLIVALNDDSAKQPGDALMAVSLPKLRPSAVAPSASSDQPDKAQPAGSTEKNDTGK